MDFLLHLVSFVRSPSSAVLLSRYHPTTDLETGLSRFVDWYSSYYQDSSGNVKSLEGYKPY